MLHEWHRDLSGIFLLNYKPKILKGFDSNRFEGDAEGAWQEKIVVVIKQKCS